MSNVTEQANNTDSEKWSHLSPLSIIHFIFKFLTGLMKHGSQGLAPLAGVIVVGGDSRWVILGFVALGLLALVLAGAFLSYIKFRFRLDGDKVLIRSGVLNQKRITLTFDRIQNVVLKTPIYFSPFNLVAMEIESTGSSDVEISLGGIPRTLAEDIRQKVLTHKPSTQSTHEAEAEDDLETQGREIIQQPISELVRYGLSNNTIWAFGALAAGILPQLEIEELGVFKTIESFITSHFGDDTLTITLLGIAGIVGVISVLLLISVLGSIIINYGYTLTEQGKRFHRKKGLFEKQENSMLKSKIQSIQIKQPWIARLLNRMHIQLKKVGFSQAGDNPMAGQKFIIPSITKPFAADFSNILYPSFNWQEITLKGIHNKFIIKNLFFIAVPIGLAISTLIVTISKNYYGFFPMIIPVIATPFIVLNKLRYGYACDDDHGIVRTGFFGKSYTIFPFFKVQSVILSQTPGQRRAKLATLYINLAGSLVTIPYLPLADATMWRDRILYKIETENKPWM